jgi:broad specificity phosphatase PhoE
VTTRLTLIGHGSTPAVRRAAFPLDEPLEEREIARIAALGWNAPRTPQILAGPERRTQQTAAALGLSAIGVAELRDCDYGVWQGQELDALQEADPEGVVAWLTDPAYAPHGGESIVRLVERVGRWMDEQRDAGHIIAVTHPAVIRSAIVHALQAPAQTFWRMEVSPLTMTDLRFNGRNWVVRSVANSLRE